MQIKYDAVLHKLREADTGGAVESVNGQTGVVVLDATDVGAEPANTNIQSHISNTSNPHGVTKSQVGLSNVPNLNTTDAVSKAHDAATAGDGISLAGQQISNSDKGSTAVATHEATYDHTLIHEPGSDDQDLSGYVPYSGATGNLDLGQNRLLLQAQTGNSSITRSITLKANDKWSRAWISSLDNADRHRAAIGYHGTNYIDGEAGDTIHERWEIKTSANPSGSYPTDMRTRFAVGTDQDFADILINYVDDVSIINGSNKAVFNVNGQSGKVIISPTSNATDVLTLYKADGTTGVFGVDTSNTRVGIGTVSPQTTLHVVASGGPELRMQIDSTNYGRFYKASGAVRFSDVTASGGSLIDFDPIPSDGTGTSAFRFFRSVNTSGTTSFSVYKGDGSSTIQHFFSAKGNSYVVASAGSFGIGGSPSVKLDVYGDVIRLRTAKTPATAGASGDQGSICWDADYIYVCTATNTWKRAAIATW